MLVNRSSSVLNVGTSFKHTQCIKESGYRIKCIHERMNNPPINDALTDWGV